MSTYSAQGSVTVKRLRNGELIFISLELNGKPLFQGVDEKTGIPTPDWSVADNQPIITPKVTTTRGNAADLSFHTWKYNGVTLNFNGAETDGWKLDSTGKFKMNVSTGALRIVANLASNVNCANDTLIYECVATINGVEYNESKSIDILIQTVGANGYTGFILASTEQLTSAKTTSTLKTMLMLGADEITSYYVKWYKDDTLWSAKNGLKEIEIDRDDVNGCQLFIAEFYKDSTSTTPLFRAGLPIWDVLDEYQMDIYPTSANKEVGPGQPVTVGAWIRNTTLNTIITPKNAAWSLRVMDKRDWTEIRRVNSNTITITTADTDDPTTGEINDVEVVGEVDFD